MMKDSLQSLKQVIDETGFLDLPARRKLWSELGEIEREGPYAVVTEGLIRRVEIAKKCVKHGETESINTKVLGIDDLFNKVNDYLQKKISVSDMEKVFFNYQELIERVGFEGDDDRVGLIGMAASHAAHIAVYDESIMYTLDEDTLDEDLDSFTWDTSYLISLLFENNPMDFWKWYWELFDEYLHE